MKKLFVTLSILVLLTTIVSATEGNVELSFSPYSYQLIARRALVDHHSRYGWGIKAGACLPASGKVKTGIDVLYSDFMYDEYSDNYRILSIIAKIGFSEDLTEKLAFDLFLNGGVDIRSIYSNTQTSPSFGLSAVLAYKLNGALSIISSTDLRFSFQLSHFDVDDSIDLGVLCNLGLRMDL